jgi:hypothetical protein
VLLTCTFNRRNATGGDALFREVGDDQFAALLGACPRTANVDLQAWKDNSTTSGIASLSKA